MMGRGHAWSGLLAWLALARLLLAAAAAVVQLVTGATMPAFGLAALAGSTYLMGGAAVLPDADHHSAVIATTYGRPGRWVARGICRLFEGHRWGTHSLFFAATAGAAAEAALCSRWAMAAVVGFLAGMTSAATRYGRPGRERRTALLITGAVAAAVRYGLVPHIAVAWAAGHVLPALPGPVAAATVAALAPLGPWVAPVPALALWWLGPAVTVGCIVHCCGDGCTPEGVPWFWLPGPLRRALGDPRVCTERYEVEIIRRTGNWLERVVITRALIAGFVLTAGWQAGVYTAVWPYAAALAHTLHA